MSLKDVDCKKIDSIEDIQKAGIYVDQTGKNDGSDKSRVSCLQQYYLDRDGKRKSYNELKEFTKKYFPSAFQNIATSYIKKLCKCCKEKSTQVWSWDKLKECIDCKKE